MPRKKTQARTGRPSPPHYYFSMTVKVKNVVGEDQQDVISKVYKALDAVGIKAAFVESCSEQDAFDKEPLACEDEYEEGDDQ